MTRTKPRATADEPTVTCVGVDPGLDGGIAWIRSDRTAHAVIMPTIQPRPGDPRDFDRRAMMLILDRLSVNAFVVIEKVNAAPMRGRVQGTTSMFNFGRGYGIWLGLIEAMGLELIEVEPRKWKAAILSGTAKDKAAAIQYARTFFPSVDLKATPRCRTFHDGMADALCLAEYARQAWRVRELLESAKTPTGSEQSR